MVIVAVVEWGEGRGWLGEEGRCGMEGVIAWRWGEGKERNRRRVEDIERSFYLFGERDGA
jgi:hypothetical protein